MEITNDLGVTPASPGAILAFPSNRTNGVTAEARQFFLLDFVGRWSPHGVARAQIVQPGAPLPDECTTNIPEALSYFCAESGPFGSLAHERNAVSLSACAETFGD